MVNHSRLKELKEKYKDEQVFVVPASVFSHLEDGFTKEKHSNTIYSKYDHLGKYVFRYDAEENPIFQQIIPYIIVYNMKTKKYYTYTRIQGSKETRLHGQMSLGFGGHIDASDGTNEAVFKGLFRELMEELDYSNIAPLQFMGYVRNMQSKTNDHTGLVFMLTVSHAEVIEKDKYVGQWMSIQELEDNYFKFEDWGKHLIDYIVKNKDKTI